MLPPGTWVMRVLHKKKHKLSPNFKTEPFMVIAGFSDGTYQLCDHNGRLLKEIQRTGQANS
ncbi:uncharacterized protein BYT42DRAFT_505314 [Radiomyces spectabilis]|uniref:uncharacterized protein n=1 Tax=Radiomyces spectabilis TaxID=64574 RepID=UPI00221EB793|nr:uncharacterized protein BYT42DRAFT_505314 [Radiomyces spectabilis]KAI8365970.1 hypothetical protein BYT42DRAFT_505314 [Radiomyces spectabilis]